MIQTAHSILLGILLVTSLALEAPSHSGGLSLIWHDSFDGPAGTPPEVGNWNIVTGFLGVNAELEVYTASPSNIQLSGSGTLQVIPWRDSSALQGWTSGRVESRYVFVPQPGRRTRVEATIRFGGDPSTNKQGIWPAFWMLGDSLRQGDTWPACGEIDILETINGSPYGHATVHYCSTSGGVCSEGMSQGGGVSRPPEQWHNWQTWRIDFDRTVGDWNQETISWEVDDIRFYQVSGAMVGSEEAWAKLSHSPLYLILNVAVGGNWPGYPDDETTDGWQSMMEVGYVAHYSG